MHTVHTELYKARENLNFQFIQIPAGSAGPLTNLQVLEVHDAVRSILVGSPGKSQRRLELPVASHGVHQALVEITKHHRIVLGVWASK